MIQSLETKRLILRPYTVEDAKGLFSYASNPNVGPHGGWKPHADVKESQEIIEEYFLENQAWAIINKKSGKLIGTIMLETDKRRPDIASKELGYSLAEEFWGKGIMTEAAKAVISYAFEVMNLDVLAICTGPTNKRSARVIEKCGFKYEGMERYCYKICDGSVRDTRCFSLLKKEWEALR